jgi:hypothetical protein
MTPRDSLIEETQRVWSEFLGRPVDDAEARRILAAFQDLGSVMADIIHDKENKQ